MAKFITKDPSVYGSSLIWEAITLEGLEDTTELLPLERNPLLKLSIDYCIEWSFGKRASEFPRVKGVLSLIGETKESYRVLISIPMFDFNHT